MFIFKKDLIKIQKKLQNIKKSKNINKTSKKSIKMNFGNQIQSSQSTIMFFNKNKTTITLIQHQHPKSIHSNPSTSLVMYKRPLVASDMMLMWHWIR